MKPGTLDLLTGVMMVRHQPHTLEVSVPAKSDALAALATPQAFIPEPVDERIIDWVEREHREWQRKPSEWRKITLSSDTILEEVIKDAVKYCTEQREIPLTFQRKNGYPVVNEDKTATMVYRVRDKMNRGRQPGNSQTPPAS
jgi:hypothetical protein